MLPVRNGAPLLGEPEMLSYDQLQRTLGRFIHGVARGCGAVHESLIKLWMIDLADDHFEPDITRASS